MLNKYLYTAWDKKKLEFASAQRIAKKDGFRPLYLDAQATTPLVYSIIILIFLMYFLTLNNKICFIYSTFRIHEYSMPCFHTTYMRLETLIQERTLMVGSQNLQLKTLVKYSIYFFYLLIFID